MSKKTDRLRFVNIYSNFYYLWLMSADEIITLSLTFKKEFGVSQLPLFLLYDYFVENPLFEFVWTY